MNHVVKCLILGALCASTAPAAWGQTLDSSSALVAETRFDGLTFKRLLDTRPSSVAELLKAIPAGVLEKIAIVQDSGSLQSTTPTLPRVLVFGGENFVFSFNGDPSQRGFEAIEVMRYDAAKFQFFFEEIVFPADLEARKEFLTRALAKHDPDVSPRDLEELGDRRPRTGVNPKLCLECHGKDPHPLAPVTPFGKGLFAGYHGEPNPTAPWLGELAGAWSTNPRFSLVPAMTKATLRPAEAAASHRAFHSLLTRENAGRLARRIAQHPRYPAFRFAIQAALADCPSPENVVRAEATRPVTSDFEALRRDTTERRRSAREEIAAEVLESALTTPVHPPAENERVVRIIARLRGLLERQMHFSMAEDFTMDGGFGTYLIDEDIQGLDELRRALATFSAIPATSCEDLAKAGSAN